MKFQHKISMDMNRASRRVFALSLTLYCLFLSGTSALGLHLDVDTRTGTVHLCSDICFPASNEHGEVCEYESVFEHLAEEDGVSHSQKHTHDNHSSEKQPDKKIAKSSAQISALLQRRVFTVPFNDTINTAPPRAPPAH